VEVRLEKNETSEKLIKRFFKKCKKQEIIKEYLEKTMFFRTKGEKRRSKMLKNRHLRKFEK